MKLQKISSKNDLSKIGNCDFFLIDTLCNEKETRRILDSLKQKNLLKNKFVAVVGGDNQFNRRVLETMKIDFLVSPEREIPEKNIFKKDNLKQRDSGLNHVIAKIAKEKNVSIIIDFDEIKNVKDKKQKALRISRIIQNIKICRRAKCKIKIIDFSDNVGEKELGAFGFSLGMSSQQVKESI